MAVGTGGTNAATSLQSLIFTPGQAIADVAAISAAIKSDNAQQISRTTRYNPNGLLYLPRDRGIIAMKPGDYVMVDSTGWPIVVSAYAIANGPWTHT